MRVYFIILSFIVGFSSIAQLPKRKIELSSWDSLYLMHKKTKKFYKDLLSKEYQKSDTLRINDSLVVTLISKSGYKLQKIVHSLDKKGCIQLQTHIYFNKLELPAYIEEQKKACLKLRGKNIFDRISYYERFEYDKDKNLILHVFDISAFVAIKEIYVIDKSGNRNIKRQIIDELDFWK